MRSRDAMTEPWEPRFWAKVSPPNGAGCWLWTATLVRGYGQFGIGSRRQYAHRVAYELLVGPVPEGLQLDHLCRTPACVNPAHLDPVTCRENLLRGVKARPVKPCRAKPGQPDDPETIGGRVRAAREAAGISQVDLAKRCGWSKAQQWQIEEDWRATEPRLSTMRTLAEALDVPVMLLIGE